MKSLRLSLKPQHLASIVPGHLKKKLLGGWSSRTAYVMHPYAGLLNGVAGTPLGLACMVAIALAGLTSRIETLDGWFDWIWLGGAAYPAAYLPDL
jgi:hypothetical protein